MNAKGGLPVALGSILLLSVFALSVVPFLAIAPGLDSVGSLWQVREIPASCWLFDPLCAGYVYVFFFEPGFSALHVPGALLAPSLGNPAHHLAGIAGVLVLAAVLARLLFVVSRSGAIALAGAALVALSFPAWVSVADTIWCHYPWATAFGLLALAPFVRAWADARPPAAIAVLASALAYGVGLSFKESVGAVPALCFVLAIASGMSLRNAAVAMLPHAAVLGLFVAWRIHVLGGLGGYPQASAWIPANFVLAGPVLFSLTWGSAWPWLALVAANFLLAWRIALLGVVAYAVAVLPFLLAAPMDPVAGQAPRLLLVFALFLLFLGAAVARRGPRVRGAAIATTVLLLVLAWFRHGDVSGGVPTERVPPMPWTRPVALVSEQWLTFAFEHQLADDPGEPLLAFRSPLDVTLARALGIAPAANALAIAMPPVGATPELAPLERDDVTLDLDDRGRVHLRIPDANAQPLHLGFVYRNGGVTWVASFPLGRNAIDLPLNPSIEMLVLFEPRSEYLWPARVVRSRFFEDPYPPRSGRAR